MLFRKELRKFFAKINLGICREEQLWSFEAKLGAPHKEASPRLEGARGGGILLSLSSGLDIAQAEGGDAAMSSSEACGRC